MGVLDQFGRLAPATTTAYVEAAEKNASLKETRAETEMESANLQQIQPEIEKVVRRKLDWHVIPLVSALCSFVPIGATDINAGTCAEFLQ